MCAGGKKPTARSIKQDFETFFESFKIRTAWRKDFFDTLKYKRLACAVPTDASSAFETNRAYVWGYSKIHGYKAVITEKNWL